MERGRGGSGGRGGGRTFQRNNAGEEWPNLVGVVLSWSLADVMNKDLFKDKVKQIPSTFPNLKSYLECYTSPLLEELRAEMSSSLESLSTVPSVRISRIEEKRDKYEIYLASDCQVAKPHNRPECYTPSVGDVILLSDVKPGHISDTTRNGRPYRVAFVTDADGGDEYDDSPPAKYGIVASGKMDAADDERQDGKSTSLFAACLLNIVTYIRIWRCLDYEALRTNRGLIEKMVNYQPVGLP